MATHLKEERHRLILETIEADGHVTVSELSHKLDVSEVTVRPRPAETWPGVACSCARMVGPSFPNGVARTTCLAAHHGDPNPQESDRARRGRG